jgi:hypothetical protein
MAVRVRRSGATRVTPPMSSDAPPLRRCHGTAPLFQLLDVVADVRCGRRLSCRVFRPAPVRPCSPGRWVRARAGLWLRRSSGPPGETALVVSLPRLDVAGIDEANQRRLACRMTPTDR